MTKIFDTTSREARHFQIVLDSSPSWRKWLYALIASLTVLSHELPTSGEEVNWLAESEMRQALFAPVGITWEERPLRDGLQTLARSQRVAFWLDRRIDPGQKMSLSTRSVALEAIFREVAHAWDGEVGFVGPVVYLGPAKTASVLWTVLEMRKGEIEKLPTQLRSKWSLRQPASWEFLSTPLELLKETSDEVGFTIDKLDSIQHDLWAAGEFPPLTAVERLTLLLAPFDLTFRLDASGKMIQLQPLPENPQLERQYSLARNVTVTPEALARAVPQAKVTREGSKLLVSGRAEDHDVVQRLVRGVKLPASTPTVAGETRYTLNIKNKELGQLLNTLEARANLKLNVDPGAAAKLKTRISVNVTEATLTQLLDAAFQGTGLTFEVRERVLEVRQQ